MARPVVRDFTYYWSGMSNGHHVKELAIAISSRLQPSVVEVTSVNESIMRLRLRHSLGFISVVAVYAPTEVCETEEKEISYAKIDSVLDQCPCHDALIVLGDFYVKSRKRPRCDHTVFNLEKLKDLTFAQEYAVTVSNRFGVLDTIEDSEELWDTFKRETLEAAKECIGERPRLHLGRDAGKY